MSRPWALAVVLAGLAALGLFMLGPGRAVADPETRALRQLGDAFLREPEVLYLRASVRDPQVICGMARRTGERSAAPDVYFVAFPDRLVTARLYRGTSDPGYGAAAGEHCPNLQGAPPPS